MYYLCFIQLHRSASIDSHALAPMPPVREAPEGPNARTRSKIFGIFPFLAAYIANLPAGLTSQHLSGVRRSAWLPKPNANPVRCSGKKGPEPNRTEP